MPGKRIQLDDETWEALDLLARDQMKSFQELVDEAFTDLLKKNGRPLNLKDALRRSAKRSASIHRLATPVGKTRGTKAVRP
jgi:predicted DNA-binding ribbon-helix-helix protein